MSKSSRVGDKAGKQKFAHGRTQGRRNMVLKIACYHFRRGADVPFELQIIPTQLPCIGGMVIDDAQRDVRQCNADLVGCCGIDNHGCSELFRPRGTVLTHDTKRWLMLGHIATCDTPDVEAASQHVWVGRCESNGRANRIHVAIFPRDDGDGALTRILDEPGVEPMKVVLHAVRHGAHS